MGSLAFSKHCRLLTVLVGVVALCGGCVSPGTNRANRALDNRGSTLPVVVGREKWFRCVRGGWFPFLYHPEGAEIRIGVSRAADAALPSGSREGTILNRELGLLRRYDDATISVRYQDRISTVFGSVPCYHLKSSDPLWRLRALVIYQDCGGQIVNVGFYSERAAVPSKEIRAYLNAMLRAKLIPAH
jgi:hypothetical protein